jgi:hypothetical protein
MSCPGSAIMGLRTCLCNSSLPHIVRARGSQELQCALDAKSSSHYSRLELLPLFCVNICHISEERDIAVASKHRFCLKERGLLGARGTVLK